MSNSVLEQFVGVLPASLTTAVENIFTYNLANATEGSDQLAASVSAQISNAINSVSSSLSGNAVTLSEVLQQCAAELIKSAFSVSFAYNRVLTVALDSRQRDRRSGMRHLD